MSAVFSLMQYLTPFLFALGVLLFSRTKITAQAVPQFKDGDRVCFIGDSITHGGSYHSNVYLYYLTRFPDREFRVWNKGISLIPADALIPRWEQGHQRESSFTCYGAPRD